MGEPHTLSFMKEGLGMRLQPWYYLSLAWPLLSLYCKLCSLNGLMFSTHNVLQNGSVGKFMPMYNISNSTLANTDLKIALHPSSLITVLPLTSFM